MGVVGPFPNFERPPPCQPIKTAYSTNSQLPSTSRHCSIHVQ